MFWVLQGFVCLCVMYCVVLYDVFVVRCVCLGVRLCAIAMLVHFGLTICMCFDCGLLCHVVWRVVVLSVCVGLCWCVCVEIFVF